MTKYRFTPQAVDDLFEIWIHIAKDNLDAADRVEDSIYAACEFLGNARFSGQVRSDLTALRVRFWLVQPSRNIWIVYDGEKEPIQIIRIIHAARDVSSLLK